MKTKTIGDPRRELRIRLAQHRDGVTIEIEGPKTPASGSIQDK